MTEDFTFEGFLKGNRLQPVKIAELCWNAGWRDLNLVMAVAVCLAESAGYTRAYNVKRRASDGKVVSTDRGLFQIKVDAEHMDESWALRLWEPEYNVSHARKMFLDRQWGPWYAWLNDIAQNPDKAGKYFQRAAWAVMNFYLMKNGATQIPSPWGRLGEWRLDRWIKNGARVTRKQV